MSRGLRGGGASGALGASAFSALSLKGGAGAQPSGLGSRLDNYGLGYGFSTSSGNMLSAHARRKQEDEILAELEADPTANEGAPAAAAAAAEAEAEAALAPARGRSAVKKKAQQQQQQQQQEAERSERRDKSYNTSLPREDAHRFRATLDEAVERLELLGLITSDSLRRRKDPSASSSSSSASSSHSRKDIFALMRREADLEAQYEQLMQRRNELRGLSNKSKYVLNQAELAEVTQALKHSTAAIAANLKDHPTVLGNLNKIQKDRQALQQLLQDTIDELKEDTHAEGGAPGAEEGGNDGSDPNLALSATNGGLTLSLSGSGSSPSYSYDVLVDAVARRASEQRLLVETRARQEKTAEALKKLEAELDHEWVEFERLEDGKNAAILDLTAQLKHLRHVTSLSVRYEQQTAVAARETEERRRAAQLADLRAAITRAKTALKTDKRVNKKSLVFLAGQKEAMDALHDQWERNYDEDHGRISRQLDDISRARVADQTVLVETQERWDKDSKAKVALIEELAVRAREEAAYRDLVERMNRAQCTIRFYWRVYWRARKKELKKLKKKKLARARAAAKAEKGRPPSMGGRKSEEGSAAASMAASARQSAR